MKRFFAVVSVVSVLFFVGCSSAPSVNGNEQQVSKTLCFKASFGVKKSETSLAKTALIGDGLTIQERVDLHNYRVGRDTLFTVNLQRKGEPPLPPTYASNFPIVNGIIDGYMSVAPGFYYVNCWTNNDDFQAQTTITVGNDDTTYMDIVLEEWEGVTATLYVTEDSVPLNGALDSLIGNGIVIGCAGAQTLADGYSYRIQFLPVKKEFCFLLNGKKYSGMFDITKMIDDGIVEMAVKEVKQPVVIPSISFAADIAPVIDSVYPANGATNVPLDINGVVVYFNKPLADSYQMEVSFTVVFEDGNDQLSGSTSFSAKKITRSLDDGVNRVYFKPGTKYNCKISGVEDEFGNKIADEYKWSFTTAN